MRREDACVKDDLSAGTYAFSIVPACAYEAFRFTSILIRITLRLIDL